MSQATHDMQEGLGAAAVEQAGQTEQRSDLDAGSPRGRLDNWDQSLQSGPQPDRPWKGSPCIQGKSELETLLTHHEETRAPQRRTQLSVHTGNTPAPRPRGTAARLPPSSPLQP